MDIDEFLDRELSDINREPESKEESEAVPQASNIEIIKGSLSTGNLEEAEKSFSALWRSLAQKKLKWDADLYYQISALSKQFSAALAQSHDEVKRKSDRIHDLINRGRAALKDGKKDVPFKIYSEVQEINNSVPNTFFYEKKRLQDEILDFYKELTSSIDLGLVNRASSLMQEISQLIEKISSSIGSNSLSAASHDFDKCLGLYNQIPEGFLIGKNALGIKLIEIYKSLSVRLEISNLQRHLGTAEFAPQPKPIPITRPSYYTKPEVRHEQRKYELIPRASARQQIPPKDKRDASKSLLEKKKSHAKRNIKKGLYNEAWNDVEEALRMAPNDVEAKVLKAKIKTLQ